MVDGFDATATCNDAAVYKSLCAKGADGDDDVNKAGGGRGGSAGQGGDGGAVHGNKGESGVSGADGFLANGGLGGEWDFKSESHTKYAYGGRGGEGHGAGGGGAGTLGYTSEQDNQVLAGGGGGGGSRAWASEVPTPPTLAALLTPSSSVQLFFSSESVIPVELVVDVESSYVFEDDPAPVVAATGALKAFLLDQTRVVLPTTSFEVTSDRGGQYYDDIEITVSSLDGPLDVEFTGAATGRWRRYERKTTRDVLLYELDGSWNLSGVYDSDTHTLSLDLTPPEGGGFGYGRDVHLVLRSELSS